MAVIQQRNAVLTLPPNRARIFFVGANDSGKSILARTMLDEIPRYIVFDPKGDFKCNSTDKIVRSPRSLLWWGFPKHYPRLIYRPNPEFIPKIDLRLRYLFYKAKALYKHKDQHFVIYCDEGLFQALSGRSKWLRNIAVTGRSLDIGLWFSAQRPRVIPVEVRSEAWNWYIFYEGYEEDDKEIIKYSKGQVTLADMQSLAVNHNFIELKRGDGGRLVATRFPPVIYDETKYKK